MRRGPGRPLLGAVAGILVLNGCASTALPPMGKGPPDSFHPEPDEQRLWARSQEEQRRLDSSGYLYSDPELDAYLNRVLGRVMPPGLPRERLVLRVRVLKNPLLNAFTYPNGVIYVHTGILARIDNEAQLATLLAHELTHATHRHTVTRVRDVRNKTSFFSTVQVITGPLGALGAAVQLIGVVGTIASIYGYSQEQELEADREGLGLMAAAGYDPREAPKLFTHLKEWVAEEKEREPFFFGTHPRLEERIASYDQLLGGEFREATLHGGQLGDLEFLTRTRAVILDNAVLDLQGGRFLQTQKGIRKYLALAPDDPRAYYQLGESYRRTNDRKQREPAIEHYRKAIALDARFADPYRGLGTLHYQAGSRVEAREAFERYLELTPGAMDRPYIEEILKELDETP